MSKGKLYLIAATVRVIVLADKKPDNWDAGRHVTAEVKTNGLIDGAKIVQVKSLKQVPRTWRGAVPWGKTKGDGPTVDDILEQQKKR